MKIVVTHHAKVIVPEILEIPVVVDSVVRLHRVGDLCGSKNRSNSI